MHMHATTFSYMCIKSLAPPLSPFLDSLPLKFSFSTSPLLYSCPFMCVRPTNLFRIVYMSSRMWGQYWTFWTWSKCLTFRKWDIYWPWGAIQLWQPAHLLVRHLAPCKKSPETLEFFWSFSWTHLFSVVNSDERSYCPWWRPWNLIIEKQLANSLAYDN